MTEFDVQEYIDDLKKQYKQGMCSLEDVLASAKVVNIDLTDFAERERPKRNSIIVIRSYDPSTDKKDVDELVNSFYREIFGRPDRPESRSNEHEMIMADSKIIVAEELKDDDTEKNKPKIIGFA